MTPAMAKPPLTSRKRKWAANREVTLRGKTLHYNASQQAKYSRMLNNIIKQMAREVNKQVDRLFRGELAESYFDQQKEASAMDASLASQARKLMNSLTAKFQQLFNLKAPLFAGWMVESTSQISKATLHSSLKVLSGGLSLKTSVVPKGMEDISKALIEENVALIKSIPQQYLKDVTGAVMRSITSGRGIADLLPQIKKYRGQTERRAKNLALDQTRKAYNSINKQRMQAIGVKQFEWVHSGGGQTNRKSHLKTNGHIFNFENLEAQQAKLGVPPEDQGIPGYPINCRCTILPVIDFENN